MKLCSSDNHYTTALKHLALETFYEALVKTFQEIYHNIEGKFNQDCVKKSILFVIINNNI